MPECFIWREFSDMVNDTGMVELGAGSHEQAIGFLCLGRLNASMANSGRAGTMGGGCAGNGFRTPTLPLPSSFSATQKKLFWERECEGSNAIED